SLVHLLLPLTLLGYALTELGRPVGLVEIVMYLGLIGLGVAFFYSLMIVLAATSVWMGRNQGLYDFWFYITIFANYPRNFYAKSLGGDILRVTFSYVIPILLVITVPAQVVVGKVLEPSWITLVALAAAL